MSKENLEFRLVEAKKELAKVKQKLAETQEKIEALQLQNLKEKILAELKAIVPPDEMLYGYRSNEGLRRLTQNLKEVIAKVEREVP